MTIRRFAATCAVAFVVDQILAVAVHGFILSADYAPFYGTLLRSMPDWRMLTLPLAHLSFVVSFVWIYARIGPTGPWPLEGLKFGVLGWLVGQVPLWLLWYAEQPWPDSLVVKQLGLELIASLILGVVVAAMAEGTARPQQTGMTV
jgi:hypothetical protein